MSHSNDVKNAQITISNCETALGRRLSDSECHNLLMDNTPWSSEKVAKVVESISFLRGRS